MKATKDEATERAIEMERIVSPREAARLRGTSVDTIRRRFKGKFIRVSDRRIGLRLRDVLAAD